MTVYFSAGGRPADEAEGRIADACEEAERVRVLELAREIAEAALRRGTDEWEIRGLARDEGLDEEAVLEACRDELGSDLDVEVIEVAGPYEVRVFGALDDRAPTLAEAGRIAREIERTQSRRLGIEVYDAHGQRVTSLARDYYEAAERRRRETRR